MSVRIAIARLPADLPAFDNDWNPADPERRAAIARKHRQVDRVRSRIADYLLSRVSMGTHGYAPFGRPVSTASALHLSASHDGEWVVAAGSGEPVGIDVVEVRRAARLPDSALSPGERPRLPGTPAGTELIRLATIWAAKEAHSKRLGVGLGIDPASISTEGVDHRHTVARSAGGETLVRLGMLDPRHILAVTVRDRAEVWVCHGARLDHHPGTAPFTTLFPQPSHQGVPDV